jgi:sugar lactone lactonase YvrE
MKMLKWGAVSLIALFVIANPLFSAQTGLELRTITAQLSGSGGVAVDAEGFVYVADFGIRLNNANGSQVHRIDPNTGAIEVFATGLSGASGNNFDSQGNLFQSNIAGNRISRISHDGTVTTFSSQGFQSPVGIVLDSSDNVYVANCGGNNIRRISADGNTSTQLAAGPLFNCPNGLTIDDNGNLYAVNFGNGSVLKITQAGATTVHAIIPGGSNGHVTFGNGKLYVAARGGNRIYEVTLDGVLKHLAGTGSIGNADGPALQGSMYVPNGVALSPDGKTLYFNDAVSTNGQNLNPVLLRSLDLE